jgi:hypothetical protein
VLPAPRVRSLAALLLAAATAAPCAARAAACCMSATAFGVGRLRIWEDAAVGLQVGTARSLGQWNDAGVLKTNAPGFSDGLTRVEPWAIVRLHERVQVQAWAPLLLNDRTSAGQSQLAGGIGDVGAAARFEVVSLGEYAGLPGLAVTLGALAPTGRRPEETSPPVFAGATGRGAWGGSLAVETEYASLPWFVRLDAGVTAFLPFRRPDTGASQRYGRVLQAALSAGDEVLPDKLFLAVSVSGEWEAPITLDGAEVARSRAYSYAVAGSASWLVDPHWTLVTSVTNNVWPDGAGSNRDARVGLNLGVRYGRF